MKKSPLNPNTLLVIMLSSIAAFPQTQPRKQLHGITVDGNKIPITAIDVIIKGTMTSTITDTCGNFSIPIEEEEVSLLFHGMAYNDLRTYETSIRSSNITNDTIVFQLGRVKGGNTNCPKPNKKFKRYMIQ